MSTVHVLCLAVLFRLGSCGGGWSPVPVDNNDVIRITKFAENQLNLMTNSMYKSVASTIHEAQRQVVAGLNWKVTFDFSMTDCLKSEDKQDCNVQTVDRCYAVVWEQPWNSKIEMTDFKCGLKPLTKPLPLPARAGMVHPIDVNDKKLLEAVDFSWRTFEAKDVCMFKSGVRKVLKASRQVVAGWKYFITTEIGYSKCAKQHVPVSENECKLVDDVQDSACPNKECQVVVWDQPWRTPRYVMLSEKCSPKN